jgi:hypothetical protein
VCPDSQSKVDSGKMMLRATATSVPIPALIATITWNRDHGAHEGCLQRLRAREIPNLLRLRESMSQVTYFVALPFIASNDGMAPGEATECFSSTSAVTRAEALSRKPSHVGAVAFSRTGDPATGDFADAKILRSFGQVPDDLSDL